MRASSLGTSSCAEQHDRSALRRSPVIAPGLRLGIKIGLRGSQIADWNARTSSAVGASASRSIRTRRQHGAQGHLVNGRHEGDWCLARCLVSPRIGGDVSWAISRCCSAASKPSLAAGGMSACIQSRPPLCQVTYDWIDLGEGPTWRGLAVTLTKAASQPNSPAANRTRRDFNAKGH
jgi:hypothetical protein